MSSDEIDIVARTRDKPCQVSVDEPLIRVSIEQLQHIVNVTNILSASIFFTLVVFIFLYKHSHRRTRINLNHRYKHKRELTRAFFSLSSNLTLNDDKRYSLST